jgi:aspartate ammonia-lyase
MTTRIEHDLLGDRTLPHDALYGIHTLRAIENFPITGTPVSSFPALIVALAQIKQATALANHDLDLLDGRKTEAIVGACQRVARGEAHEHFVVDVIQGGAGVSTNMNANEVIANLALDFLGCARGDYRHLHPHDDVNLSQSADDVYPAALRIACHQELRELIDAMSLLECAFDAKARECADAQKMRRSQLRDTVPMTLGQAFRTCTAMLSEERDRLRDAANPLRKIDLGASAINTHPHYARLVCGYLTQLTGIELAASPDLAEATRDVGAFVQISGVLKCAAVRLSEVCNDLRLVSSGSQAGLGEIDLPPMQAGSGIVPGGMRQAIPEVVNQIAFEVIGNDATITLAVEAGQWQLNAFEPIIAHSLHKSIRYLINGCRALRIVETVACTFP